MKRAGRVFNPKRVIDPRDALWEVCLRFIEHNEISCPEAIFQADRVAEVSLPFIEEVCAIVGYAVVEEGE